MRILYQLVLWRLHLQHPYGIIRHLCFNKMEGRVNRKHVSKFHMKKAKPAPGLDHRCKCGWGLGENLSGDCGDCNAAIAKLPKSNRRSGQRAKPIEEREFDAVNGADDVNAVLGLVGVRFEPPAKDAQEDDDVFQKDKRPRKPSQAQARKKAEAEAAEPRNLREKHDADGALSRSGFTRGFEEENGSSQANLLSCDWLLIHIPRDGHCLMHCFVRILQMRQPGHETQRCKRERCTCWRGKTE